MHIVRARSHHDEGQDNPIHRGAPRGRCGSRPSHIASEAFSIVLLERGQDHNGPFCHRCGDRAHRRHNLHYRERPRPGRLHMRHGMAPARQHFRASVLQAGVQMGHSAHLRSLYDKGCGARISYDVQQLGRQDAEGRDGPCHSVPGDVRIERGCGIGPHRSVFQDFHGAYRQMDGVPH